MRQHDILFPIGAEARSRAAFGQGTGSIFIDNVVCDGQELRLIDCASNPLAAHDCSHSEDAGVVCQPAISRKLCVLVTIAYYQHLLTYIAM